MLPPDVIEKNLVDFLNRDNEDKKYCLFEDRFARFDFFNCDYLCEVKSRSNRYNQYPTTMVGYNKVKMAEEDRDNPDINYRFYFVFTDGTYCWDYKEGEYQVDMGGRRDRGLPEIKEYAYIPIENLYLVTTEVKSIP